ncbi:MAG: hypothetical protein DMG62_24940 [Acidobacteria bacterium]|nr:MAG: hypothetical protein DMG62_24940 [Acidobacteriota bacterium]
MEVISATNPQHLIAYFCRAIALWLHNSFEEALAQLEHTIKLELNWNAAYFFWKGMIYASQKQDDESIEAIGKALDANLPPILLAPVRWLKEDIPDFYNNNAMPLLIRSGITEVIIIAEKQTQ